MGERPPPALGPNDAGRALIEGQGRQFETPSALIARYAGLFVHGLPTDHHARFSERLEGVSVSSLVDVASRHVRPEALVAVVVADASQVLGPLEGLGWAKVEVVAD